MKIIIISLLVITIVPKSYSQDEIKHFSADEVIDIILDEAADDQDLLQLREELEYYKEHPINIAAAQYGDLLQLPLVSPMLAEAIILYRDTVEITSTEQLLSVSLMTAELYSKIAPFVTVSSGSEHSPFSSLLPEKFDSRTRMERRIQVQNGFRENKFAGDMNAVYQRMRIGNGNFEIGGLLEKDAGELVDNGFSAGYIVVNDLVVSNKIVLGNYSIASDQGLVFAKNISSSKGSNSVSQIKLRNSGLTPSVSTDENRYLNGAALHAGADWITFTGFHSIRHIHANVDSTNTVTSIFTSGRFRTANDLKKKNTLDEKATGGRIEVSIDRSTSVSFNAVNIQYDKIFVPELYDLTAKRILNAGSIGWTSSLGVFNTFGEFASNDGDRFSKVFGLIFPFSKKFSFSYHLRSFTKGYVNPMARPFGERSNIADGETGNYIGIQWSAKPVDMAAYVDFYSLPSTLSAFGTEGRDALVYAQYQVNRNFQLTAQARSKFRSQSGIRGSDDERYQSNIRIGFLFDLTGQWSFAQRIEAVLVKYAPSGFEEYGFLTFCETRYSSRQNGLTVKARMVFFETESYDSRLYQYESDVAGNFSNPPLYGKGIRWYLVAGYEVLAGTRMSLKYSETKKFDVAGLGSGDDEILGSLDNALALQIDFSF